VRAGFHPARTFFVIAESNSGAGQNSGAASGKPCHFAAPHYRELSNIVTGIQTYGHSGSFSADRRRRRFLHDA
jgi:hypothetical protein